MLLQPGTRLGPYEIVASLGAGGMGEVYRARDTKLNRDVALKILPESFAGDPDRLARFTREAQTLAALNHPHIAQIHGLEESPSTGSGQAGVRALVMELVEGPTLAELIAARTGRAPAAAATSASAGRGAPESVLRQAPHALSLSALEIAEALPIACQIAEALEAAHDRGIIHRDLKPANIKVRDDGTVKVLDFGLAKALVTESASATGENSPTMTSPAAMTRAGIILGTAAYMAPEQARGKAVDKRADIWAFGCVLYEMLSGRRPFAGEDITDTLTAVMRDPPDWNALPAATPVRVRTLLARCLDKDPKQRLRDIGEARVALRLDTSPEAEVARSARPKPRSRLRAHGLWLATAAACVPVAFALGVLSPWRPGQTRPAPPHAPRTLVLPAPGRTIEDGQAISPDGTWVAFTAGGVLWIRNLGELEPREVPDSRGARRPFWSPRSDAVAFAAGNALFKVSRHGGKPVEICRISRGNFTGGSWSASKGIVFTSSRANWDGDVLRVAEEGGEPGPFTRADAAKRERRLHDPHFLPDGRGLLFTVVTQDANDGEIAVDRDGARTLLGLGNGASQAVWSPTGHVVFTRGVWSDRALWALPFSLEALAPTGDPFRLAVSGTGASVSADGTLVYGLGRPDPQQLVWVDRVGKLLGAIGEPVRSAISFPALSPDGRRVAAVTGIGQSISVWDTGRGVVTRVTGESEVALFGGWIPGGEEIVYARLGGGLWVRRADGSGDARVLLQRATAVSSPSFSRDGKHVAFYAVDRETGRDLWALAASKPDEPFLLLRTKANEALPRISPDGRFVAYQSDASGRWEVYVQPFPRGEGRWQVSVGGGQHALWNPRGGELFFVSGNDLMAVDVAVQPAFRVGTPRRLFGGEAVGTSLSLPTMIERFYDVASDGSRFVVVRGVQMGTSEIVLAEGVLTRARHGNERDLAAEQK